MGIDFIIYYEYGIIPIEVKSDDNIKSCGLTKYIKNISLNML